MKLKAVNNEVHSLTVLLFSSHHGLDIALLPRDFWKMHGCCLTLLVLSFALLLKCSMTLEGNAHGNSSLYVGLERHTCSSQPNTK